ncbi:hypothetical protein Ahy_B07g086611 [Arachis hypogaea]|uniref:Protein FAR1-RELATED SEQUENCE n=1 Tax=Arachis hypogaea TaxID=3818 RepID=A0A444YA38_ARAHY|nr:hypothetical protein Ahy_B07g086611 [Arachis hypogaea]
MAGQAGGYSLMGFTKKDAYNYIEKSKREKIVDGDDGCDSMKAAIKAVFLKATHRLCSWHMEKNVTSNVKDEGLRQLFTRWIYSNMEIEEFEAGWDVGAEEYRLHDSFWAKETYDKRRMWADA